MRVLIIAIALGLSIAGAGAAEGTGERIKSDARSMAHGVKGAAVSAGKQIGQGSKKAYRGTKAKIKGDVNTGKPGDGSLAARNEKMKASKDGRD